MDLMYANRDKVDKGALINYYLDSEESNRANDNTFEGNCAIWDNIVGDDGYIYAEGTELGGIVDSVKVDTAASKVYHKGRTWRGVLASKILEPDVGAGYYRVSGELNGILSQIVSRVGLSDFFIVDKEPSGMSVSGYKFRYEDAYTGIVKMLSSVGAKLHLEWRQGKIHMAAVPIIDFDKEKEISSDLFDFIIEQSYHGINHMIGLGKGELTERQVIHKYLDKDGNISSNQVLFGMEEYTKVYDYPNCESLEDLEEKTIEELLKEAICAKVKVNAYDLNASVGDKFTATDMITGVTVTQFVTNKITTLEKGVAKVSYKVGDIL